MTPEHSASRSPISEREEPSAGPDEMPTRSGPDSTSPDAKGIAVRITARQLHMCATERAAVALGTRPWRALFEEQLDAQSARYEAGFCGFELVRYQWIWRTRGSASSRRSSICKRAPRHKYRTYYFR